MILDSSAVISVIAREPGHEELEATIAAAEVVAIGSPTLFETAMVMIGASGDKGRALVSTFGSSWDLVVVPFEEHHAEAAIDAFKRFGKGRHPAALNILDCMAYATARIADEPLLFIGNDFARTDIEAASFVNES